MLSHYRDVVGGDVIHHLEQLASPLKGLRIVHVNSTRTGGGVAEILTKLVPLQVELGLDSVWEVIRGNPPFFQCTKTFHNALQGDRMPVSGELLRAYEQTNAEAAEELRETLQHADLVIIHDPQPAALLSHFPRRKGRWIWRCHIDVSHPYRPVWQYLRNFVQGYEASVFSLPDFARVLPHPQYLVPPAIDPLSDKNCELDDQELEAVAEQFGLDQTRPLLVQVSRFDRFKDPLGVIEAFRLVKRFVPDVQLVLAGGSATDDPEGEAVLAEVREAAGDDPAIRVLALPGDAHRTINALQRLADIVIQKSVKEGFGLTVTEGLWKGKPVIGGNTGGIRIQVVDHRTGFLVNSPEGAALRIRYLLHNPRHMAEMGRTAREYVRENFLITRLLREHLTLMLGVLHGDEERISAKVWNS